MYDVDRSQNNTYHVRADSARTMSGPDPDLHIKVRSASALGLGPDFKTGIYAHMAFQSEQNYQLDFMGKLSFVRSFGVVFL